MAGFDCPSSTCDWCIGIGIDPDAALTIIAKREEGDTRFRVYASGRGIPELLLLHTCGEDDGGGSGDREPPDPYVPEFGEPRFSDPEVSELSHRSESN